MNVSPFTRLRSSVFLAATMLAGCSALPAGGSATPTSHADRGRASWMSPEAAGEDLLYVGGGGTYGYVHVYSYPQGKLVGKLTGLDLPYGECVDASGDVWIVTNFPNQAIEYAHGGTTPIATLSVPGSNAYGCAVDPASGNLAVATDVGVARRLDVRAFRRRTRSHARAKPAGRLIPLRGGPSPEALSCATGGNKPTRERAGNLLGKAFCPGRRTVRQ